MELNLKSTQTVQSLSLEKVWVGKTLTDLEIQNGEFHGRLTLRFGCGFTMHLDERGIAFERVVNRPNHDHCNTERLMEHCGTKKIKWIDTDHPPEAYTTHRMEFGPRTVDW